MLFPLLPMKTQPCELAHAAGLDEPCPGQTCAFWEDERGCVLGGVRPELATNPELVSLLIGIREQLAPRPLEHTPGLPGPIREAMNQIAIVVTLKPDAAEDARRLLDQGPPFDPADHGFERHSVFLSANEAVFVFDGTEVEWKLDDLVDDPFGATVREAFDAWRPLIVGEPRVARTAYSWERTKTPAGQ